MSNQIIQNQIETIELNLTEAEIKSLETQPAVLIEEELKEIEKLSSELAK